MKQAKTAKKIQEQRETMARPGTAVNGNNPAEEVNKTEPNSGTGKTEEPVKKLMAVAVDQLSEMKIAELGALVHLKMEEIGHLPVQDCISSIAATVMSATGIYLDGLTMDIEKLQKAYPSILGIWKDPARSRKDKLSAIASVFDSVA